MNDDDDDYGYSSYVVVELHRPSQRRLKAATIIEITASYNLLYLVLHIYSLPMLRSHVPAAGRSRVVVSCLIFFSIFKYTPDICRLTTLIAILSFSVFSDFIKIPSKTYQFFKAKFG